jgi:glycosyltransferase involved in cell wall biosynthesis
MHAFVIGYPSFLGGADTELWHVLRLWVQRGMSVTLIPTWLPRPEQRRRLDRLGVQTIQIARGCELPTVATLPGSIAIGFCNAEFLSSAERLRRMQCPLIWVNCMTYVSTNELEVCRRIGPFDAYVFQSQFQLERLAPIYRSLGASPHSFFKIRSPISFDEFPFAFHARSRTEPFVVGRIARPDPAKWFEQLFSVYRAIRAPQLHARLMAWSPQLTAKCGSPPDWVCALQANAESSETFLKSLHCLVPINGGAEENWPRAGLEAMASGIPIVTENNWGWREMIRHGRTGFLSDITHLAECATVLVEDDDLRYEMARAARADLELELANPEIIWGQWKTMLSSLGPL